MAPIARTTIRPGPWARSTFGTLAQRDTNLTGTNNDLRYKADDPGTGGNATTITYVVAGNNTALSVSVAGTAITVNVATDGAGAPTSTAAQVMAAVNAHAAASALVTAFNATGNDGTGVVTAMAALSLQGAVNDDWARGSSSWRRVRQGGTG